MAKEWSYKLVNFPIGIVEVSEEKTNNHKESIIYRSKKATILKEDSLWFLFDLISDL